MRGKYRKTVCNLKKAYEDYPFGEVPGTEKGKLIG